SPRTCASWPSRRARRPWSCEAGPGSPTWTPSTCGGRPAPMPIAPSSTEAAPAVREYAGSAAPWAPAEIRRAVADTRHLLRFRAGTVRRPAVVRTAWLLLVGLTTAAVVGPALAPGA